MKILDCSELGLVSGGFGSVSGSAGANNYVDQTYGSMGKLSGGTYVPWNQNTYDCLSAMAQTALWAWGGRAGGLIPGVLGYFPVAAQWGTCTSGTSAGTFYNGYSSISDTCW